MRPTSIATRSAGSPTTAWYIALAAIGTVLPWIFFAAFFGANGPDVPAFLRGIFANGAAGGFTADVLISIAVFLVWSYPDARTRAVRHWWLVLPSLCVVGLSLAFPLYLVLRHRTVETPGPTTKEATR
ncbi:DUF2834 domain-containing protein [Tsukamurella sp. 8F]|uniref:DUF2834 domain-containing protein n=1 Tax=unclassified Tsukamurella TaxID=2633480 RepID=UPI0023BA23C8|nr:MULTISPECIES: DUF2834 domain-containing protein [unclassified Tsukamurella]MDF0531771.1 DUF2834 domain-containing protein [Tsukamurella sp. 8J]MDF0588027.1 DUF2834 domain-containing protein [Tsukamurella sp. 8F]